jgi:hypothetical protein
LSPLRPNASFHAAFTFENNAGTFSSVPSKDRDNGTAELIGQSAFAALRSGQATLFRAGAKSR